MDLRRPLVSAAAALVLGAAALAHEGGGFAAYVEALRDDPSTTLAERRTLNRALDQLAVHGTLGEEAAAAVRAVEALHAGGRSSAGFRGPAGELARALQALRPRRAARAPAFPGLGDAELDLVADWNDAVVAERAVVASRQGTLGDDAAEARLAANLRRADASIARSGAPQTPLSALRHLSGAASRLMAAIPPLPSFRLEDVNPNSATAGNRISPRDHAGAYLTAWYFTHLT